MKTDSFKSIVLCMLFIFGISGLFFSCQSSEDDDDDDGDGTDDPCDQFCDVLAYCELGTTADISSMDECLIYCQQVGSSIGKCVLESTNCAQAQDCFEDTDTDDDTVEECASGELWDEELGRCVPEECGFDKYPTPPEIDDTLTYVDIAYEGSSDGTIDAPYRTIFEALDDCASGSTILIAAGDYGSSGELVMDEDDVNLIGRCPFLTRIIEDDNKTALFLNETDDNIIQGIGIEHSETKSQKSNPQPLLKLHDSVKSTIRNIRIENAPEKAILVSGCREIQVIDSFISRFTEMGIRIAYSEDVEILGTEITESISSAVEEGLGAQFDHCQNLSIKNNIVDRCNSIGLSVLNSSEVDIESNDVRDIQTDSQGSLGSGIEVQNSDDVSINSNRTEECRRVGINVYKTSFTASQNEVHNNRGVGIMLWQSTGDCTSNHMSGMTRLSGAYGTGIHVQDDSEVSIVDNSIHDNAGLGILAIESQIDISSNEIADNFTAGIFVRESSGEISSNTVIDTQPSPSDEDEWGIGIVAWGADDILIIDNTVEDNHEAGILVNETLAAEVTDNNVRRTQSNLSGINGYGIRVDYVQQILVKGNLVEENSHIGISLMESTGRVESNTVLDTHANDQGNAGEGIFITNCPEVDVVSNTVEDNLAVGIYWENSGGSIEENSISGTQPGESGTDGMGIEILESTGVLVEANTIRDNCAIGILFRDATGQIIDNEIRLTQSDQSGELGHGIEVQNSEAITIQNNILEENKEVGIILFSSSGEVSGNDISKTLPNEEGAFGSGIEVQDSTEVTVSSNTLDNNRDAGIVFHATSGSILLNTVTNTAPGKPNQGGYTFGHGIQIQAESQVDCSNNILEGNHHAGIFLFETLDSTVSFNEVRQTTFDSRGEFDYGDGIVVVETQGTTSILDNTIENNDRCGILADASVGMIERNGISGNENSVVIQNQADMTSTENDIHDNGIDEILFFENREFVVNDSMIERNGR